MEKFDPTFEAADNLLVLLLCETYVDDFLLDAL